MSAMLSRLAKRKQPNNFKYVLFTFHYISIVSVVSSSKAPQSQMCSKGIQTQSKPLDTSSLHLRVHTCLGVVDLATLLTALVRPREVCDWDDEKGVAGIRDTGEGVVPGNRVNKRALTSAACCSPCQESGDDTKSTTSLEAPCLWQTVARQDVCDPEEQKCQVQCEE